MPNFNMPSEGGGASGVRPAPSIANLFPEGVVAFESNGVGVSEQLFDAERFCIKQAVEKRVQEFASGRACARAALVELGSPALPIPAGTDRAPKWPTGFVGSISHTSGRCVAVASRAKQSNHEYGLASLGVDIEQRGAVTPDLWSLLMHRTEVERLQALNEKERGMAATLMFSAKEAFYKAQYLLTRSWMDFDDVVIEVCSQSFVVHITNTQRPIASWARSFNGRFLVNGTHVVTGIAI